MLLEWQQTTHGDGLNLLGGVWRGAGCCTCAFSWPLLHAWEGCREVRAWRAGAHLRPPAPSQAIVRGPWHVLGASRGHGVGCGGAG